VLYPESKPGEMTERDEELSPGSDDIENEYEVR
jgi:hypothetical protein